MFIRMNSIPSFDQNKTLYENAYGVPYSSSARPPHSINEVAFRMIKADFNTFIEAAKNFNEAEQNYKFLASIYSVHGNLLKGLGVSLDFAKVNFCHALIKLLADIAVPLKDSFAVYYCGYYIVLNLYLQKKL